MRFHVSLRAGLIAMAFGLWIMACGSISVIGSDGATGSGGTSGDGIGGGHGGLGGKSGAGGVVGGVGGRPGTGGAGGFAGGGLGGTAGSGAGGSGGATCSDIQKAFVVAMVEAKTCVVGATGYCLKTTLDRLDCGCPTYVNQTDRLDFIRQSWNQNGCSTGVCTAALCVGYRSGVCTASTSGGMSSASCQDSLAPPLPTP